MVTTEISQEFALPNLKAESHRQLPDPRVYGCAADNAELSRRKICIRVRELRMVERIEELSAQFECTFFVWRPQSNLFPDRQIQIRLAWTINDSRTAVAESRCDIVCANHRRSCETRRIKVVA
jgi:hypothetical protein